MGVDPAPHPPPYAFLDFFISVSPYVMIICVLKRILHKKEATFIQQQDDHLQEVAPSGWSFARGRSLRMVICNHEKGIKMHIWDPSQWDKMGFENQRIKFQ